MSDIAVTIISTAAVAMAGALGYTVARLRDLRAQVDVQQHALDALAAPNEPGQPAKKRRHLYVVRGLLPLISMAALATWLRKHWRTVAGAATAAGAASVLAVAVLAHGNPGAPRAGAPPTPPGGTQSAPTALPSRSSAPSTKPRRTPPRRLPPIPLLPVRSRRPVPAALGPSAAPPTPGLTHTPSGPVRSPIPPPKTPTATHTPTCLLKLSLGKLVQVCI